MNERQQLAGGFYHPEFPEFGVEAISGQLFDGRVDKTRLIRVLFHDTKGIVVPSFEDMIADRLGQYAASSGRDHRRLAQARLLLRLAEELFTHTYRRRRRGFRSARMQGGEGRMKTITLTALREQVERKKAAIGWVDDEANIAGLRNAGTARTSAKRELLTRIDTRAKDAGCNPLNSKY